jgi:hypothetical protein
MSSEETDIGPTGFSHSVEEKFQFYWGTITVVASYDAKLIDGYTVYLHPIEITLTDSNISVSMPDGTSFCYEYNWMGINPDKYSKTISPDSSIAMLFDQDGLGVSVSGDTTIGLIELEIKFKPRLWVAAIENILNSVPPFGGAHGGGPWDMQNKTLLFK